MAWNIHNNTGLISTAIHEDHGQPHVFDEHTFEYAKNAVNALGMGAMGLYRVAYAGLNDGDLALLRLTADGKLMVDASVSVVSSGGYTQKAYYEGTIDNVGITVNFGFTAREIIIFNDGDKTVNYELAGAPAANVNTLYAGEAFVDTFESANIQLATFGVGDTTPVRIWARG